MERRKEEDAFTHVDQVAFLEELYVAKCKDTREHPSREEFLRFTARMKSRASGPVCSLRNQHLGASAANTLSKFLRGRPELVKVDLYCNVIRDHGLQVISHLLQSNASIRIVNLGCNDLTDKSATYLAEVAASGHVKSMQVGTIEAALHPNKLTSATLFAISEAVIKTNTLQVLGMSGAGFTQKTLPNTPPAVLSLVRMLSRSSSLRMVRFSNCEIASPVMLDVIENGLAFNSTLQRIDFSGNGLSSAVGIRCAEYLLEPVKQIIVTEDEDTGELDEDVELTDMIPHIFYMDLSGNQFSSSVAACFSTVLLSYPFMGYLNLGNNDIGDEGARALAQMLGKNQTLVELHLSGSKITSRGGIAIAEALKTNETLTTLNLSKNKLGDEAAFAIADAITVNTAITTLLLSSSMLSNEGGIKLAEASPKCPSLITLDMSDNFFTESAGAAMERLFRENQTILKIDVSGTQINHFAFHALNEICARNAATLKQKQERPLRNQLVKSQYSVVELKRKERILEELCDEKDALQEEIDKLDEQINNLKQETEINANILTKQIQEKKQQMANDERDFEDKMKKLEEQKKEFEEKKVEITKNIEAELAAIKEMQDKTDEKKTKLATMTEEFEKMRAAKLKEIEELDAAANELLKLAQDTEALNQMEQLPEFIVFEEDNQPEVVQDESPPLATKRSRRKKTSRSRKSKTTAD